VNAQIAAMKFTRAIAALFAVPVLAAALVAIYLMLMSWV